MNGGSEADQQPQRDEEQPEPTMCHRLPPEGPYVPVSSSACRHAEIRPASAGSAGYTA
ncbi:MAG: hypothetical protein OZSIB_4172 [Candidatus Ozemobacter sibiricus]|uniref:Uncharacterized protein n=1 Tax=Candidatus Ozemobacter sibiricus TaxID=2268124 RepID=A0A367ZNS9_9BACT|nr:MAG: hypothetical protein OZSIB_4172 [Candidatus Ozemobacter sibiricus]